MLPNLIVIGAMKAATSSLHFYLDQHPDIFMSVEKEPHFFVEAENWRRGCAWYEAQFPVAAKVRGESSPGYAFYPRNAGVAERMHDLIPDAKLIYIVRDPVARAVSHYTHFVTRGYEKRPPEEAILDPARPYLACSRYALQLDQYLPFYPRERMLILAYEDLIARRDETMAEAFAFLDVDTSFRSAQFEAARNVTATKRRHSSLAAGIIRAGAGVTRRLSLPSAMREAGKRTARALFAKRVEPTRLSLDTRDRLADALAPDAKRFREIAGRDFADWSV